MDFIIEFLLELILEGSLELAGSKKVPLLLRVLAGMILAAVYGGLMWVFVSLLKNGVREHDVALTILGALACILLIVLLVAVAVKLIHGAKGKRTNR